MLLLLFTQPLREEGPSSLPTPQGRRPSPFHEGGRDWPTVSDGIRRTMTEHSTAWPRAKRPGEGGGGEGKRVGGWLSGGVP